MKDRYSLIFWTTNSLGEAKKIASLLIEKKLVACANIIHPIYSMFHWEGRIEQAQEVKVVFKTKASLYEEVETIIRANASYEVPEILQIPIERGSTSYLEWMEAFLKDSP